MMGKKLCFYFVDGHWVAIPEKGGRKVMDWIAKGILPSNALVRLVGTNGECVVNMRHVTRILWEEDE